MRKEKEKSGNPYESANLSPIAKTPTACALPYGLTWDDLRPSLPGFATNAHLKAQAFASYDKQGLHGGENSCILMLRYPDSEGRFRSEMVFIKQTTDFEKAEAKKYRYLASQDMPTPHLLGTISKGDSEIILLEFLPTIGINFHETFEVESLLRLVAQLNSLQQPAQIFNSSPKDVHDESHAAFDRTVKNALSELAQMPGLPLAIDVPTWFRGYQIAQEAYHAMPLAVNHNEFYFQQVGWAKRGNARQLVIFDLETLSLSPRFSDVANVLLPLAIYGGREQVELFEIYLRRLGQLAHTVPDIDEALHELKLLRITSECYSLPWHVREAKNSQLGRVSESLSMTAICLHNDLTDLGFLG